MHPNYTAYDANTFRYDQNINAYVITANFDEHAAN